MKTTFIITITVIKNNRNIKHVYFIEVFLNTYTLQHREKEHIYDDSFW